MNGNSCNSKRQRPKSQVKAQRTTPRWPNNLTDEQFAAQTSGLNVALFVRMLAEITARAEDSAA